MPRPSPRRAFSRKGAAAAACAALALPLAAAPHLLAQDGTDDPAAAQEDPQDEPRGDRPDRPDRPDRGGGFGGPDGGGFGGGRGGFGGGGFGGPGGPPGGPGGGFGRFMQALPVMAALDADGDGVLSEEEIANASKALAAVDKNGDGRIDGEEMRPDFAAMRGGGGFGGPGGPPGDRPPRGEGRPGGGRGPGGGGMDAGDIADSLMRRDADGDGKLTGDEIPERLKRAMERVDADKDGAVSREEIVKMAEGMRGRRGGGDAGQREGGQGRDGARRGGPTAGKTTATASDRRRSVSQSAPTRPRACEAGSLYAVNPIRRGPDARARRIGPPTALRGRPAGRRHTAPPARRAHGKGPAAPCVRFVRTLTSGPFPFPPPVRRDVRPRPPFRRCPAARRPAPGGRLDRNRRPPGGGPLRRRPGAGGAGGGGRPAARRAAAGGGGMTGARSLGAGFVALRSVADAEPGPHGWSWGRWRAVAAALPPAQTGRGRRGGTDLATAVAAVRFREATGTAWRRLPAGFPPWQTVYALRERWRRAGALPAVLAAAAGGGPAAAAPAGPVPRERPGGKPAGAPRAGAPGVGSCGSARKLRAESKAAVESSRAAASVTVPPSAVPGRFAVPGGTLTPRRVTSTGVTVFRVPPGGTSDRRAARPAPAHPAADRPPR